MQDAAAPVFTLTEMNSDCVFLDVVMLFLPELGVHVNLHEVDLQFACDSGDW